MVVKEPHTQFEHGDFDWRCTAAKELIALATHAIYAELKKLPVDGDQYDSPNFIGATDWKADDLQVFDFSTTMLRGDVDKSTVFPVAIDKGKWLLARICRRMHSTAQRKLSYHR